MRSVIYVVAAIALGLWTLFAWAVHAFLGVAAGFAVANTWLLPVPPEWVYWTAEVLDGATGIGSALVWIGWGLGAALIALFTLLALKLVGRPINEAPHPAAYPGDLEQMDARGGPRPAARPSVEDIVARVSGRPQR
jgi:hypothetical protein